MSIKWERREAGIFFSLLAIFGALYIGFEAFLGWKIICFSTGFCYLMVEKYVDKFLDMKTALYHYSPMYFMMRGIIFPAIFILVLELSGDILLLHHIKYFLLGYLICHVFSAIRKGLKNHKY